MTDVDNREEFADGDERPPVLLVPTQIPGTRLAARLYHYDPATGERGKHFANYNQPADTSGDPDTEFPAPGMVYEFEFVTKAETTQAAPPLGGAS